MNKDNIKKLNQEPHYAEATRGKQLNQEQKKAVEHSKGPLLIVAGAGTGKTTVLIERMKFLLEQKLAKLDEILLLTFTEKGAGEMEERALRALPYGYLDMWVSTFHGFGEKLLRLHALDLGLNPDFSLLNQTDQWILLKNNLDKFQLDYYKPLGNPNKFIYELIKHFSRLKDENISPQEYLEYAEGLEENFDNKLGGQKNKHDKSKGKVEKEDCAQEIARLKELAGAYFTYNQILLEQGDFDFGDLINHCLKLFKERPNLLKYYQKKFKYIMIDEFQDTNWAQYELVKVLAGKKPNLMVVGDDDQAIYKFRGASLSNIMQFKDDYKKCKEVVLKKNYRSGQKILDSAYSFIQNNNPNRLEEKLKIEKSLESQTSYEGELFAKQFSDSNQEEAFVADQIIELTKSGDSDYSDCAILIRANSQADAFLAELKSKNIPATFVSLRGLYYKPIIMDLIAYMKLLDDYHESSALFRVLNTEAFRVGHADIININRFARRKNWSLFETLKNLSAVKDVSEPSRKKVDFFLSAVKYHSEKAVEMGPARLFVEIVNNLKIHKNKDFDQDQEFFSLLNQFYQKIRKFEQAHPESRLKDFVEYLDMEIESGETGALRASLEDSDTVKIMTVHSAKGLEFKNVFLPQIVDKKFPTINRRDKISIPDAIVREVLPEGKQVHLEEERRLFYVALTRAKERLFLSGAKDYGGAREKKMSVFAKEANLSISQVEGSEEKNQLLRDLTILSTPISRQDKEVWKPKKFSFSQIEAYNNCPLQYKFNFIMKVPVQAKAVFVFGRVIHNTLHDFMSFSELGVSGQESLFAQKSKEKKAPSYEVLKKMYKKNWQEEGYASQEEKAEYKKLGQKMIKNFFEDCEKNGWPRVLFLEKVFTAKINNFPFRGAIDRIDELEDGSLEVLDYKTGEAPKTFYYKNKKQLLLYKIALEETLGKKVSQLTFHYLKNSEKKSFSAAEKDLEKFRSETVETIEKICSNEFPAKPSMLCAYCDFNHICEFRQK